MAHSVLDLGVTRPPFWNLDRNFLRPDYADLWEGLVIAVVTGGRWPRYNLVTRKPFTVNSTPDFASPTPFGSSYYAETWTQSKYITVDEEPLAAASTDKATSMFTVQPGPTSTVWAGEKYDFMGGNMGGFVKVDGSSCENAWAIENKIAGSYVQRLFDIGLPPDRSPQSFIGTRDGTDGWASRNGIFWAPGVTDPGGSCVASSFPAGNFTDWGFNPGNDIPGDYTNQSADGWTYNAFVWARALSPEEQILATRDPWGLVRPAPRRVLVTVATSPALEGYRWRNDDGSEAAATYAQAQDTDHSVNVGEGTRLRAILDNHTAGQVKIQAAPDGTEDWFDLSE